MTGADPIPRPVVLHAGDRQVVAAFDFDGTLTGGGSVWRFLSAMRGRRAVAAAVATLAPRLVAAALLGGDHADRAKEALFTRVLGGLALADVERDAAAFGSEHLRRRGRQDMLQRLAWHQRQGHRTVIVSASPALYLHAVAQELGVDAVVATRLAVGVDGLLTGCYDGRNCRGAEKIGRLRHYMAASALRDGDGAAAAPTTEGGGASDAAATDAEPFLWAYGNSAGDRQLLAAADIGVDVGKLGRWGKLRRFPRLAAVPGPR